MTKFAFGAIIYTNRNSEEGEIMKRILMALCVGFVLYSGATMVFAEEPVYTYQKVVVGSGDTMWDIACHFAQPGEDVHELIFNICQWNKLKTKTLQPGQVLMIRVPVTDEVMLAAK